MIYQTVIALALASAASATLFTENKDFQVSMWESFKREHHKVYASAEEEQSRFSIFLDNLKLADERNARERKAGGAAVHGVTKFSDMSQGEFAAKMLATNAALNPFVNIPVDKTVRRGVSAQQGLVDWTGSLTTPVKDQGYCGSCWAFSTTEQIESDAMRLLQSSQILSAEQITQCAPISSGCRGGFTEAGFAYAENTPIVPDALYPYTSYYGRTGDCTVDATKGVVRVKSFKKIKTESDMAAYVQSTGPLSICIDATTWNSYTGGIMTDCGKEVNHCVQAVGVDASEGGYWKVRNSWASTWGESGYIRLAYGKDTCAVSNDAIYSTVELA